MYLFYIWLNITYRALFLNLAQIIYISTNKINLFEEKYIYYNYWFIVKCGEEERKNLKNVIQK